MARPKRFELLTPRFVVCGPLAEVKDHVCGQRQRAASWNSAELGYSSQAPLMAGCRRCAEAPANRALGTKIGMKSGPT